MPIEVELFDDLDAVARDAGGALDRPAQMSLFDRLDWFRLTLAHCPPPGEPLIARAADGDRRCWLFLTVDGARAQALASWYTLDYRAIAVAGGETLLPALAAALRRRRPRIAAITLAPVGEPAGLAAAFRAAGWIVRQSPTSVNWRVPTSGGFSDYWSRRPKRLRETIRRKSARAGLEISMFRYFDQDAFTAYEAIYAASWKPAEGSPAFLRALARIEGDAGTLRLGIARKDGVAVAAQLWLVENKVATIHKLAHAAAADALSPGTLLTEAMFRSVIEEDRPDWIDFGAGDDAYKADWMDARHPLHRLDAFDRASPRGLMLAGRAALGSLVRGRRSV